MAPSPLTLEDRLDLVTCVTFRLYYKGWFWPDSLWGCLVFKPSGHDRRRPVTMERTSMAVLVLSSR